MWSTSASLQWLLVVSLIDIAVLAGLAYGSHHPPSGLNVVTYDAQRTYDGYLVFCMEYPENEWEIYHGPRIFHPDGTLFWAGGEWHRKCMNAQIQTYLNRSVLTFWYSNELHQTPFGTMLDTNYSEVKRVHPKGGTDVDLHEFRLNASGASALMILMKTVKADLRAVGGGVSGDVYSPFVQEIALPSGDVVWEWSGADYLDFRGSFRPYTGSLWEFAHCNSVSQDDLGDYLMSFRAYSAIIKVNGKTKGIMWMLGGKHSDFSFHNGSTFTGQHDPQWVPGTNQTEMTIFDNDHDLCGTPSTYGTARGIRVQLDYATMNVKLVKEYLPSQHEPAEIEGGIQILPNDNVLVAFGSSGTIIEYTPDGEIVFEGHTHAVYKAFKYDKARWKGAGLGEDAADSQTVHEVVQVDHGVHMIFGNACSHLASFFGLC